MAQIKLDEQNICSNISNVEINNVVVSSSAPFGYNATTKVLTLPNNSQALTGYTWGNEVVNQTNFLSFSQINGTINGFAKRVYDAFGSVDQRLNSFENNGVGIEIIYSAEAPGGVVPNSPSDLINAAGTNNRKYPNHRYYLWFDVNAVKFTQWWDAAAGQWKPILQNTNTIIVDGKASPGLGFPTFATMPDAYAYLNALPTFVGTPPPSLGPIRPSADNRWTILIYNRVVCPPFQAQDYVNVVFMPGSQLYIDITSATEAYCILFDGNAAAPIRGVANRFDAVWTAAERYSVTDFSSGVSGARNGASSFHIIGLLRSSTRVMTIAAMQDIALNGLSVYALTAQNATATAGLRISGACASINSVARNVTIKDMTIIAGQNVLNDSSTGLGVSLAHESGNVYLDNCVVACDFYNTNAYIAIELSPTAASVNARTYILECSAFACQGASSRALNIGYTSTGKSIVYGFKSYFEAYGVPPDDYTGAAIRAARECHFVDCTFRIASSKTSAVVGNALNGLSTSSAAVFLPMENGHTGTFINCIFSGDSPSSTGITMFNNGTWADTKVILYKCVVRGRLASVVNMTATTSNTKRFFSSVFEGPIAGTPFGCAVATGTAQTNIYP